MEAALIVDTENSRYVIDLKVSPEGRRDRMVPLLSQAIIQAAAMVRRLAKPNNHVVASVGVVASRRIPEAVAARLKDFVRSCVPDACVGFLDAEGFRWFSGPGLEGLNAQPPPSAPRQLTSPLRPPNLFSDLNQWMLKILLGQGLIQAGVPLISVPRDSLRNASHLAAAAGVSVMTATRLLHHIANEGFIERSRNHFQMVRVDELLERWASANRHAATDIPARWILKQHENDFFAKVADYAAEFNTESSIGSSPAKALPRCCVGLFAAANALGAGFVRGVPPHLYMERPDPDILQRLGLTIEGADRRADVYVRIPSNKESIFRAAVMRDRLPVTDVLQVWLDTSGYPARGREQADAIRRGFLRPLFTEH